MLYIIFAAMDADNDLHIRNPSPHTCVQASRTAQKLFGYMYGRGVNCNMPYAAKKDV